MFIPRPSTKRMIEWVTKAAREKGACYKIQKKIQLKEIAVYLTQFLSSIRFLEDTSTYIFACIEGIFSPFESTMAQEEGNKDFEVRNFWH